VTAVLTILLHALQSTAWAAYILLEALSDNKILYSLGAMTTCSHANIHLNSQWELLGAMEPLEKMLLFGLPQRSCSRSSTL
jgi:hypothetical protein